MRCFDTGRIHSIQTLGTLDGPGVRFVVFLQGCNLRCACCHNPDTWDISGGKEYTAAELAARAERYKEYFGADGGVTLSGGEPLLQAEFAESFFDECKKRGINTCLDTSGSIQNAKVDALLALTDRVLLDIKYPSDELYRTHVGCSISKPLEFLARLNEKKIPTTLRNVVIPTLNDSEEAMLFLKRLKDGHPCVDKIELLPFKKLCTVKYDALGIPFPLSNTPEPTKDIMDKLQNIIKEG